MSIHTLSTPSRSQSPRATRVPMLGVTAVMLPELDFDGQIELCQSLGVGFYQYRPREIAPSHRGQAFASHGNHRFDLTPQRLLHEGAAVRRRLRDAGIEPWGTLPAIDLGASDDELKPHFEGASLADGRRIGLSPPAHPREPFDYADFLSRTIERYHHVIERFTRPLGLKILIETHRDGLAASPCLAWNIVRHFAPRDVSVIFDLCNLAVEGAIEPNLAISMLGPYIDCVHIGGARSVAFPRNYHYCAMSESSLHLPTWLTHLRAANIDVPLIIEDFRGGMSGSQKLEEGVRFLRDVLTAD